MLNNRMQIIIPMSGFGERFRRAGYTTPKPLIEIDGKPIIAHVIDLFPEETDFIFICNTDHLNQANYRMESIIKQYCPTGKIIGIPAHKLGPIYAVLQAKDVIDADAPTIVNYCDFTCYWDWKHFKHWIFHSNCKGAVPAYRGFHPHSLGTTNYAYIQHRNLWMTDIQEKKPFTDNRMDEYASSGTYYFSSGKLMLDAFQETVRKNIHVGEEFYVSLAYKYLLTKQLPVAIYDLQHFMQWGTPEDVKEYQSWSHIFRQLNTLPQKNKKGTVIIPLAGLGQRFINEGYTTPKPLIPVSGRPMILQATNSLPLAKQYVFVIRKDMPGFETISNTLLKEYPNAIIETVTSLTEGQACTALIGLNKLADQVTEPVVFGACDNACLYNQEKLNTLLEDDNIDVIVWGVRGHPHANRHPEMYGWIDSENNNIKNISVKTPLSSPENDPIVIGTFIFKRATDFRQSVKRMIDRNCRINREFYIDTCINDAIALGLRCHLFEVDHYISWGTPNDLRTFEYWQSCFHKWKNHPYSLQNDYSISKSYSKNLEERYQPTQPPLMEKLT